MKKKFVFTKESSFTHLQDEMHQSVTEHIIEDDETKKLYHMVVSYGSWFRVSYESIFMSHLLKKIGVTGFCVAYSADECEIRLPWYPYHKIETKSIVELPEFVKLEDTFFGDLKIETAEEFKKSFVGKTFIEKDKTGKEYERTGEYLLPYLFDSYCFRFGTVKMQDKAYPLYCILKGATWHKIGDLKKMFEETYIIEQPEIKDLLEKFVKLDIEKGLKSFEDELGFECSDLKKDLLERQDLISEFLTKEQVAEMDL